MNIYIIVATDSFRTLQHEVNANIAKGYVPIGGIGVDDFYKYQAMILENKPDDKIQSNSKKGDETVLQDRSR